MCQGSSNALYLLLTLREKVLRPHSNTQNLRLDGVLLWLSPSFGQLQEMLDKLDLALLLELSILLVDPPFAPATEITMLA